MKMSTIELKKQLFEKIQNTTNKNLLEEACQLFDIESIEAEVYLINEAQNRAISEAEDQIKSGKFLTNEKANSQIEKWLK